MKKLKLLLTIIAAWLAAGTLDILGAVFILGKGNAAGTFEYIAGAVVRDTADWSENRIWFFGAAFHYLIALCWTVFYFLIYKAVKLDKLHISLSALLYGAFIFLSMRYIFLPLLSTLPPPKPITKDVLVNFIKNILILAVAFGATLKLFARNYYGK
jgi:uncharacterized membrane protein YagU involved in acid resistance